MYRSYICLTNSSYDDTSPNRFDFQRLSNWDYADQGYTISNATITDQVKSISTFTFDIYPNNPRYTDFVVELPTNILITVESEIESGLLPNPGTFENVVFFGRVCNVSGKMDNKGNVFKTITCEQVTAFLNDVEVDTTDILIPGTTIPGDSRYDQFTINYYDSDKTFNVNFIWYVEKLIEKYNAVSDLTLRGSINWGKYNSLTYLDKTIYVTATYGTTVYDLLQEAADQLERQSMDYVRNKVFEDIKFDVRMDDDGFGTIRIVPYGPGANSNILGFLARGTIEVGINQNSLSYNTNYGDIVTEIKPLGEEKIKETEYINPEDGQKYIYEQPSRWKLKDYVDVHRAAYRRDDGSYWLDYMFQENNIVYDEAKQTLRNGLSYSRYGLVNKTLVIDNMYEIAEDSEGNKQKYITPQVASRFLNACKDYLLYHSTPTKTFTVKAYDLTYIDDVQIKHTLGKEKIGTFSRFRLYDLWAIRNPYLGIVESLPIVRLVTDLDNPSNTSIELGSIAPRLTQDLIKTKKESKIEAGAKGAVNESSKTGSDNYNTAGTSQNKMVTYASSTGGGGEETTVYSLPYLRFIRTAKAPVFTTAQTNGSKVQARSFGMFYFSFYLGALYPRISSAELFSPDFFTKGSYTADELRDGVNAGVFAYKAVPKSGSGSSEPSNYGWTMGDSPIVIEDISFDDGGGIGYDFSHFTLKYEYDQVGSFDGGGVTYYVAAVKAYISYQVTNWTASALNGKPPDLIIKGHFKHSSLASAGTNRAPYQSSDGVIPGPQDWANSTEYGLRKYVTSFNGNIYPENAITDGYKIADDKWVDFLSL